MSKFYLYIFAGTIYLVLGFSCATKNIFYPDPATEIAPPDPPIQSIYFFGSIDEATAILSASGPVLAADIALQSKDVTLLMLGNNVSKLSFLDSAKSRKSNENRQILQDRFDFIQSLKGKVYALPGAREWSNGGPQGKRAVRIWESYLETQLDFGDIIKPDNGCPGPEEIQLTEDVVLLLIDTQWWMQDWAKTGREDGCDVDSQIDFLVNLDDAIKRNYNKKIIVAGHHALYANGPKGGKFPFKTHLFPFTEAGEKLYIPLPGVGSLYVLYRNLLGEIQDLSNPKYKQMARPFREIFRQHENLIYLSGNELSLEYHRDSSQHYINSGSIGVAREVSARKAVFSAPQSGFGVLRFYENGSVWLEFLSGQDDHKKVLFREELFSSVPFRTTEFEKAVENIDYTDSSATAFVTDAFHRNRKKPGMSGNNYRMEWETPIAGIPYFDIENEHGGLEIVQRGGGMQTKSMRLKDVDDREFVLRSIEKFPENAIPDELRGTIAEKVISNGVSSSHPYGALVVPYLADAAGVYHTNPQLVWLPEDPRLGMYKEIFGGGLYLYEERPDTKHKGVSSFGFTQKIVSTPSVLEEIIKDSDHFIDQQQVLRSRLFDILIGDWDRHDDQWRWAVFENEEGFTYYQPIPRDRDQAFFCSDGWFMKLSTRRWGMPKFQGFHHQIRDVAGMNFNARYFDRTFLTELELSDWIVMAENIQQAMTDEVIENAIRKFPPEIFKLHGELIVSKLKTRRNDLPKYAEEMYRFLAREVEILGSDNSELFQIDRLNDEETKVTVYRTRESTGEIKYKTYERLFKTSETKEIRVYGFDDRDRFHITGDVSKGIRIRIIGGRDSDIVNNMSRVTGPKKQTIVYDKKKSTQITGSADTRDRTSDKDVLINLYERESFKYNVIMPLLSGRYNPDDGIFIGAGVLITTHGFRKEPFKNRHILKADMAPHSKSYNFSYTGHFTDLLGKWDLILNTSISAPSYSDYFYGYGNETVMDGEKVERDDGYYRARYKHYVFHPELEWTSANEDHRFLIGGGYQAINIRSELNESGTEQERFIIEYAQTLPYQLLDELRHYVGVYANYSFDNTNSVLQPSSGFRYNLGILNIKDVGQSSRSILFSRIQSSLSYFYTFGNSLKSTLALRAGGIANVGDYEFYHSSRLGGDTNFRGVGRLRLAGQQAFFQNTDLRIKLFSFQSPVLPADFGITLFYDFARVWQDDDPSTDGQHSGAWHRGWGGGIWLAPLSKAAIGMDYSWSTLGESAFFLRLGFFF